MEEFKRYAHNPPHYFKTGAKYFITASTYLRKDFLSMNEAKSILLQSIKKGFSKYSWLLEDWVILNNHYHLMVQCSDRPDSLPQIINEIHRFSALKIKKVIDDLRLEKRIWYNYWDTCVTYERSYYARINYIWFNPVKHGYVNHPSKWEFGSFYERFHNGENDLKKIIEEYPCDRLNVKDYF